MFRTSKAFLGAIAGVAALSGATIAEATPLTVGTYVEVGDANGNAFTPSPVAGDTNGLYTDVGFLLDGTRTVYAWAGVFSLNYRAASTTDPWEQFLSFCLEPDVYLTPFSNPYSVNTLASAAYPQQAISELWGRYFDQVTNDTAAAAFQVSLWELAYGTSDRNLSTGAFRLTSGGSVGTLAQSWLNSLNGQGPLANDLVVLVNNPQLADRQDLVTQVKVPEPATLGLLGFGLLAVGFASRRRA